MHGTPLKSTEGRPNKQADPTSNIGKYSKKQKPTIADGQAEKILAEAQRLLRTNENLEGINLLRALKENLSSVKSPSLGIVTVHNLGVSYYQVGFLEQAFAEFATVTNILKENIVKALPNRNLDFQRLQYETHLGKVELQACILFSEMGKHDLALEHARNSCRTNYNLVYQLLILLHLSLNRLLSAKNYSKHPQQEILAQGAQHLLNGIAVLTHLVSVTKDLKLAFAQKDKLIALEEAVQITRKFGRVPNKIDLQMLYKADDIGDSSWIYRSKILDEIQLQLLDGRHFQDVQIQVGRGEIIEKITFLAISLYCFSTETRFIEKLRQCDPREVLDSEHWLSRSLQIAYMFLPPEAPILNQILTVHDRFHGLDKQTIPEDEEVSGFFKVLRPLAKPKTVHPAKNPLSSPVMIRIQADKLEIDLVDQSQQGTGRRQSSKESSNSKQFFDERTGLQSLTRNNKIRGLGVGIKRFDFEQPTSNRSKLSARSTLQVASRSGNNFRSAPTGRKINKGKQRIRANMSQLNGKAVISEDLLCRPHSFDNKLTQNDDLKHGERKRKSLPAKQKKESKRPGSLGATLQFQGLRLRGHRVEQTLEGQFFERLQQESKMIEATRMGGNVFINNNINLFISKPQAQTFVRGQVIRNEGLGRRQAFLNRRRANNFVSSPEDF